MYELGPPFTGTAIPNGTNLLLLGPPLAGKRRLAMETLAVGARADEGTIIVTTRDSAARIREAFATLFGEEPPALVVDTVTQHIGRPTDADMTKYTASPRYLSAIGSNVSEFTQSLYTEQQIECNRVLVDSLTTLLVYTNLQAVFRFLHVFTSRIECADGLGLYTIASTAHDSETLSTLSRLFDGTVEFEADGTATLTLPNGESRTGSL